MSENRTDPVTLTQIERFQFKANFAGSNTSMILDEPAPHGKNTGPSPDQLLCAAVANCMSDALFGAISRKNPDPTPLTTTASAVIGRNEENRLRIQTIEVSIKLGKTAAELGDLSQPIERFENFCTVASSVSRGIPVKVRITDSEGTVLKDEIGGDLAPAEGAVCSLGGGEGCMCGVVTD